MKVLHCLVLVVLLQSAVTLAQSTSKYSHDVDPWIGTTNGGDTFPGPALPFGMVRPGPDTGKNEEVAGWAPTGDINGFSQTHVSGTGGGASSGNILIQPTIGPPQNTGYGSPRHDETVSLGYYKVMLDRYRTNVEISTAARASIYRFTYPASQEANLLIDAGHCLSSGADVAEDQQVTASSVNIVSPTEVSGFSSVKGGWNKQPVPYTVYFYAITDNPATSWGTWNEGVSHPGQKAEKAGLANKSGAWLRFVTKENQKVVVKIGISYVSVEKARENALQQIPGFNFDEVHQAALRIWDETLGKIDIKGATLEQRKGFYTALYHSMLMPSDRTGDNPLWQSTEPYFDDFYTLWDTFRSNNPLVTLIAPQQETNIVRALIDISAHDGWMPDGRQGNYNGRTQGGSNGDVVLADAYVKGLRGIDWETGYKALLRDAEVSPKDQFKEGRGGLDDWRTLGFLSMEGVDRPGSKQMEYAYNDFAVATVAKGLGKTSDYEKYLKRSQNWQNLWDADFEDQGSKGFIRPRHRDGKWRQPFTAKDQGSFYGDTFYEGDTWTYSLFVPHDVKKLMEMSGGREKFANRLDKFFQGSFDVTNEPGFLTPYLYIWAGQQFKTAAKIREVITKSFHPTAGGLPGNEDSGAMSSWYAFSTMGFFPNAGQDVYLIGSPLYPLTAVHLGNGKMFTVRAERVSADNKYVVEATLNGKPLDQAWFRHADIMKGGELVLKMAAAPGSWPKGDLPPSSSDR